MNPFKSAEIVGNGIDPAEYIKQDFKRGDRKFVMSRSELCALASCPSKWVQGAQDDDDTASTEWGSLIDCLVTDQNRFHRRYIVKPETYTNEEGEVKEWSGNAKVCRQWLADNADKIPLKNEDLQAARSAVSRIRQDAVCDRFLMQSKFQVMVVAVYADKETGIEVPIKCLLDLVPDGQEFGMCLGDLKTTRDASPFAFKWQAFRSGYHVQAALYMDAYNAADPEFERTDWRMILQENKPPYQVARRWMDSEMIALGRAHYLQALALYCQCLKNDSWPSWDDKPGGLILDWGVISPDAKMVSEFTGQWFPEQEENKPTREILDFQH